MWEELKRRKFGERKDLLKQQHTQSTVLLLIWKGKKGKLLYCVDGVETQTEDNSVSLEHSGCVDAELQEGNPKQPMNERIWAAYNFHQKTYRNLCTIFSSNMCWIWGDDTCVVHPPLSVCPDRNFNIRRPSFIHTDTDRHTLYSSALFSVGYWNLPWETESQDWKAVFFRGQHFQHILPVYIWNPTRQNWAKYIWRHTWGDLLSGPNHTTHQP